MKKESPIRAIRRAGVPLVAFETADPAATIKDTLASLNGQADKVPQIVWDIVNGWIPLNPPGKRVLEGYDPLAMQLPDTLKMLAGCGVRNIIAFIHNAPKFFERDGVTQGIWNLRDVFKSTASTLILLGPSIKLPMELSADVIVVPHVPPDRDEIGTVVDAMIDDARKAGASIAEDYPRNKVIDGLSGLQSLFDVEQTTALNIKKEGVDVDGVWQRKIARLKDQTGAEIKIGCPKFDSLAGCANSKGELSAFINGRFRPGVLLFMDEVEKAFGGAGTDLSGVSTNMLGQWLSWTQDNWVRGFLFAGIPGSGKTWTGECAAGEAGIPFFKLSMAEMKGSLVGESEAKLKAALGAVKALAGDLGIMLIASCNWVDNLAPEIMSRFSMGTFFYDFPNDEERAALWAMYMSKYGLVDDTPPESTGWVGREIETACWRAWQYKRPLAEVARNIVPSCISQKSRLEQLRKSCANRFLSAQHPGLFECAEFREQGGATRVMKF